tara:strand:+ start:965 stop:1312 length:348 start_codon:yes stop_codon:yes gene_type:complete
MSSKSKRKGSGYELEVVRAHLAEGVQASKQPLSGALGGKYAGDVQIAGLICECKRRRKGFSTLYKALEQGGGSDALFVRDDNRDTLVVLPFETWTQIMGWLRWAEIYPAETTIED